MSATIKGRRLRGSPGPQRFARARAVAFDLDGTLYLGRQVVPGAPQVVAYVRDSGLDVLFLTNTSSDDPRRLAERLAGLACFGADCESVAANVDADYPGDGGRRLPAARETIDRVAARLGRSYDFCAGKPGTYMLECVERDLGLVAGEIVVVGDSVTSDIAMARAAGCRSILIAPEGTAGGGANVVVSRLTDVPAALRALGVCLPADAPGEGAHAELG
jgi:ribonucleotide monophosphatase NagD (HAD superfamily)